jgi:hypothetical protein
VGWGPEVPIEPLGPRRVATAVDEVDDSSSVQGYQDNSDLGLFGLVLNLTGGRRAMTSP